MDYSTPDPSLFEFTPPPGATVTEHAAPDAAGLRGSDPSTAQAPTGTEPTVVGEGWSAVVIAELPADALANLAEVGMRATSGEQGDGGDGTPAPEPPWR